MKPNTVALVRSSWAHIEAIAPTAASLFYQNLFEADPSLRRLFKGDMTRQGEKLMQMIGAAIGLLDDLPRLVPVLQALAARHVGYGVQEAHYQTVGAALLKTLSQGLADDFTPAVREAWSEVYGAIAEVMIAASRRACEAASGSALDAIVQSSPAGPAAPGRPQSHTGSAETRVSTQ